MKEYLRVVLSSSFEKIQQTEYLISKIEEEIHIIVKDNVMTGLVLSFSEEIKNTKVHLQVGKNSIFELIEEYDGNYLKNEFVFEYNISKNAFLKNQLICLNTQGTLNFQRFVEVNEQGNYEGIFADLSRYHVDAKISINLIGEGAKTYWRTASICKNVHKNIVVDIKNLHQNTEAKFDNYGVAMEQGELVFKGIGTISRGSKNSSTHQISKIVVFDENCIVSTNPYLFIDENEVQASHASSVGKVDDNHIFYLCSRGISEMNAKKMITLGYLTPVLNYIGESNIKDKITKVLESEAI